MSASLIKDGTDFRLLLTTDETGVANSVQITSSNITADVGGADVANLSTFDFDTATTTSDGLQQTQAAENAAFQH